MSLRINLWHFSLALALWAYRYDVEGSAVFVRYEVMVGWKGTLRGYYSIVWGQK